MFIVVSGNPVDGFGFVGPFEDSDDIDVEEYGECWIAELHAPEDDEDDEGA
jgi:hypothetical protein